MVFALVSCQKQASSALDKALTEARKTLPKDLGNGMMLTTIEVEGDYIAYTTECNEKILDIDVLNSRKELVKKGIVESLTGSSKSQMQFFLKICKIAKKGLAFKYVGKESGKVCQVEVPYDELSGAK